MNLNFGSDPEVFAVVEENGKVVALSPALMMQECGLTFLDSDEKHPAVIKTPGYTWMQDGVAFEITLHKIFPDMVTMQETLRMATSHLSEFLSKFTFGGKQVKLFTKPIVGLNPTTYVDRIWSNGKVVNQTLYQGFIRGCDPDEDAIETSYKCATVSLREEDFRCGGGHIHLSGFGIFGSFPVPSVRILATLIGNYCVSQSPYPKEDRKRGLTYGRPGRFRSQHYKNGQHGVEYRTPSNAWLSFSDEQMDMITRLSYKAAEILSDEEKAMKVMDTFLDDTIKNICEVRQEKAYNTCMAVYNF